MKQRSNLLDRSANAETTRNEKGQSTNFSHLFKMPDFSFLFFLIHFRFSFVHSLSVFLFSFVFVSLFDRIDLRKLLALLAAQLVSFHCSAAREILRQTTTACDRVKHSIDEYDDVFDENIRFSVYIKISKSRGISRKRKENKQRVSEKKNGNE